jgi:hypothetical protein
LTAQRFSTGRRFLHLGKQHEDLDQTRGIPKSYGHLVAAVVNGENTGLVFEDAQGVIRLVTIAGKREGELTRF